MPIGAVHGKSKGDNERRSFIENESLPSDNNNDSLFERDVDGYGGTPEGEDIEFQTQNQVPGIDSNIEDPINPFSRKDQIMGSTKEATKINFEGQDYDASVRVVDGEREFSFRHPEDGELIMDHENDVYNSNYDNLGKGKIVEASMKIAAKNSLDLLGVKDKKIKNTFDKEENLTQVDRSPGDSLYGDDKETQGRHITNMKGKGNLKTGMVKRSDLGVGDDIAIEGETFKVSSITKDSVIARHAFTSQDHLFTEASFNRISVSEQQVEVGEIKETTAAPLFFEGSKEEGLFPVEDDTLPTK